MFIGQRYQHTLDEIDECVRALVSPNLSEQKRMQEYARYLSLRRQLRDELACANR